MKLYKDLPTTVPARSILLGIFILLLGMPISALANDDLVTCDYLQSHGKEIRLQVGVNSPPPPTLIVIQEVPPGVKIKNSQPRVNKFNAKRGVAKWLLKKVASGSFVLAMSLDKPIPAGVIRGEIRYKNPVTGVMVRMPIVP